MTNINYGSLHCDTWDHYEHPTCKAASASFCGDSWCYVNASLCKLSTNVYRATHNHPGYNLFFSYDTCNNTPPVDNAAYLRRLNSEYGQGRTFSAAVPWSWPPFHYKNTPDGEPITGDGDVYEDASVPWNGIYVDYLHALQSTSRLQFDLTIASGGMRAITSSAWTASVRDVASGVADVAVADFWVTIERTQLTGFTMPIRFDSIYLFVPRPGAATPSFFELAKKIFYPFTPGLWGTVIAITISMSLLEMWLQRDRWRPTVFEPSAEPDESSWHRKARHTTNLLLEWLYSLGQSTMHLTVGLPDTKADTIAHTIAWIGWSVFLLLIITGYTANVRRPPKSVPDPRR